MDEYIIVGKGYRLARLSAAVGNGIDTPFPHIVRAAKQYSAVPR